jgi:hypothetical protein
MGSLSRSPTSARSGSGAEIPLRRARLWARSVRAARRSMTSRMFISGFVARTTRRATSTPCFSCRRAFPRLRRTRRRPPRLRPRPRPPPQRLCRRRPWPRPRPGNRRRRRPRPRVRRAHATRPRRCGRLRLRWLRVRTLLPSRVSARRPPRRRPSSLRGLEPTRSSARPGRARTARPRSLVCPRPSTAELVAAPRLIPSARRRRSCGPSTVPNRWSRSTSGAIPEAHG